jgi:hypothetical protein
MAGADNRAFVLCDNSRLAGVFTSFDEADIFADKQGLGLEHLTEYRLDAANAGHLFLMEVASAEGAWAYHGLWERNEPSFARIPEKVRLLGYKLEKGGFQRVFEKEYTWKKGLTVETDPLVERYGQFRLSEAAEDAPPGERESPSAPKKKGSKLTLREPKSNSKPLRLKQKKAPEPIPEFKSAPVGPAGPTMTSLPESKSSPRRSVDLDTAADELSDTLEKQPVVTSKHRTVAPIPVWLTFIALAAAWTYGLLQLSEKTLPLEKQVNLSAELFTDAEVQVFEPSVVVFQKPVEASDPSSWVKAFDLEAIGRRAMILRLDLEHLQGWSTIDEGTGELYTAPESLDTVAQWWEAGQVEVQQGYFRRWDDGSLLLLDIEGNRLYGWLKLEAVLELAPALP